MTFAIVVLSLALLMLAAYRGYSVILFAPLAALLAVLLTDPAAVPSVFTGLFMERMVGFLKLYFPVFLLGAVFGKLIELAGFSQSIAAAVIRLVGEQRAILSIVLVCALLTYGGVSLFVVVFAVYPFAAEIFLNALLDISRLESGAVEPVSIEVALTDIFQELASEFASVARARDIDLHVRPTSVALSTDRTLFYQLLQNVLGNALKYTDRGWVRLEASEDVEGLVVAVEDSGIGIPADKVERIFDEYYQVDTHGTKRTGVGLGLAIVKEVARLLGFSVKILSKVGEGTRVLLRIPNHYRLASAMPAAASATPATAAPSTKPRLILVEDNEGVRVATELFLKLEGYETASAPTLAAAEVLLERLEPGDVVIADYHLDGKATGLDMLVRLRARLGYNVPAVVLTGDLPSVLRSLRAPVPACKFLSKPVDTVALIDAISDLSAEAPNESRVA